MDDVGKEVMNRLTGMPKCPNCHLTIDHLIQRSERPTYSNISLRDGMLYEQYSHEGDSDICYECPECFDTMPFYSESEAKKFLEGG